MVVNRTGMDKPRSAREFSDLQRIKVRYEHALALARESRCVCNRARNSSDLYRDLVDYLLNDDPSWDATPMIRAEARSQHCPVHSPPVSERPWLLKGVS